jgi:HAD superfamily hydrolase (TIGR01509 family)
MMGMSGPEWSSYMREQLGVPLPAAQIGELVVERLLAGYARRVPLLPDAAAAVGRLADRWPLGLASSADRPVIDAVLAATGLGRHFAATVSGEEVAHGKPSPDIYLEAAKRVGADPARSAAIEDSSNGLRAGASAGMFVVAIPNRDFPPSPDALALADLTLAGLGELHAGTFESLRREGLEQA